MTRETVPFHPVMLGKVLLYAYAVGIPASRQIARELEEDVAFRVLAATQRPDFRPLSDVRKQHLAALVTLFVEVRTLCRRAGLVTLGHLAVDGTKVKANASKHKAMSDGRMVTEEARLTAEVTRLLTQAEAADVQDDTQHGPNRRGDELSAELARREQRLVTIRAAKTSLEQEAQAAAALQQAVQDVQPPAQPRRGRPPQPPSPVPRLKARRNVTDPESRLMPTSGANGSVLQGYPCQAAVDARAQSIVATDVTDETTDKRQAQPMLPQVLVNTEQVPRIVRMDAGYGSEGTVTALMALGGLSLILPDRQLHGQARPAASRGRPPVGLSGAARMRRTLRTQRGRRCYAQRKAIIEPVFGQIKQGCGYRQFLLRGLEQVREEWAFICTTHNMLKLWTALRRRRQRPSDGLCTRCRRRRGMDGDQPQTRGPFTRQQAHPGSSVMIWTGSDQCRTGS